MEITCFQLNSCENNKCADRPRAKALTKAYYLQVKGKHSHFFTVSYFTLKHNFLIVPGCLQLQLLNCNFRVIFHDLWDKPTLLDTTLDL